MSARLPDILTPVGHTNIMCIGRRAESAGVVRDDGLYVHEYLSVRLSMRRCLHV